MDGAESFVGFCSSSSIDMCARGRFRSRHSFRAGSRHLLRAAGLRGAAIASRLRGQTLAPCNPAGAKVLLSVTDVSVMREAHE